MNDDRTGGPAEIDAAEARAIDRALHAADGPEEAAARVETEDEAAVDASRAEYEEVLANMPFTEVAPPPELEARVLAAARAARPPAARALGAPRAPAASRRLAVLAAAAAAAAVVAVIGLRGGDPGDSGGGRDATLTAQAGDGGVESALARPGARTLDLAQEGTVLGRVVLGDGGDGFVHDLRLPRAPAGRTYWLWLDTPGGDVPAGDLGRGGGRPATFALETEGTVDGAFVTVEDAGGDPAAPSTRVAGGAFAARS